MRGPADESVAEFAAVAPGAPRSCSGEAVEDFAASETNPVTTGCLPGFRCCPGSVRSKTWDMKQHFVNARIKAHISLALAGSYFGFCKLAESPQE